MSAVRFMAFADRSWSFDQDVQKISRFSCMLFLSVRRFFDYAGPINPLAIGVVVVLPSSLPERSRHPDPSVFRSSIARPTDTSVYASSGTSRCRPQDSRPGWSRCLLSCRALSSPTTCRFSPAHSDIPTNQQVKRDSSKGLPECYCTGTCCFSSLSQFRVMLIYSGGACRDRGIGAAARRSICHGSDIKAITGLVRHESFDW